MSESSLFSLDQPPTIRNAAEHERGSSGGTAPAARSVRLGGVTIFPPLFQAPMAGYTNYAFRRLLRELGGVGLLCTEMVSARGFLEIDARKQSYPERLWGVRDEPRPLAVQIWDNEPGKLGEVAARIVEEFRPSSLDINFGCPAEEITHRVSCGAFLLQFPDKVGELTAEVVRRAAPVPVTAKIRLGWTDSAITAPETAAVLEQAGAAAVFVHARTAQQKYRGTADWDRMAEIKARLRRIPLIGNGDIRTWEEAAAALRRFPVDGVMIGRAAISRPWLFAQASAALAGRPVPAEPSPEEQRELLLDLCRSLTEQFDAHRAVILMRKYVCRFCLGRPGAKLLRTHVSAASDMKTLIRAVDAFYSAADKTE
ncbi:MAG: tRNA-dihydrouridine synthase [Thermogutta sp.]|nr:tRNA-dihydrouridine synthase [Thermogutta sp.]